MSELSSWLVKAFAQGTFSLLPASHRWNRLLQKHVSRSLDPASEFQGKLSQLGRHLAHANKAGCRPENGLRVIELGTGVSPVVPVGLFLSGASVVYTVDLVPLCTREDVCRVLRLFLDHAADGSLDPMLPSFERQRIGSLVAALQTPRHLSAKELLSRLDIRYEIVDGRATGLPDSSIDLLISNNVLEHVSPESIREISDEFWRLAAPGAIMSHFIDMGDHYAHFDKSLSAYNFLKYRSWMWRFANNSLQLQNRLRMSDYARLFTESGWEILSQEQTRGGVEELPLDRLAPEFRRYDLDDLLTKDVWLVCRPAGG